MIMVCNQLFINRIWDSYLVNYYKLKLPALSLISLLRLLICVVSLRSLVLALSVVSLRRLILTLAGVGLLRLLICIVCLRWLILTIAGLGLLRLLICIVRLRWLILILILIIRGIDILILTRYKYQKYYSDLQTIHFRIRFIV